MLWRALFCSLFGAVLCCFPQPALQVEDPQLRAEAVHLMERAVMLTTPVWPANEELFTFKVLEPGPGEATEGSLKISVRTPANRRWEFTYGTYKYVRVQNGNEYATNRTDNAEPPAVTTVRKMLPVFEGQFDASDIIRKISDGSVNGTKARCIEFDSVMGDHRQTGEACVDAERGFLLSIRQGNDIVRQSAYYPFNDAWLPGHLERWTGDRKLFEIESKVTVRTEFPPEYFDYPLDPVIEHLCRAFSRAYADQTPQPEIRSNSTDSITVKVHGRVGKDGRTTALKVLTGSARTDLLEEALRVVSGWTFRPAQCEYKPTTQEMDFVVTFKGW